MKKTLKTLATLAAAFGLAFAAEAKNYQSTPAWTCDFGDDYETQLSTYIVNGGSGLSHDLLGNSGTASIFEQETATAGAKNGESYFKTYQNTATSDRSYATFTFPEAVTNAADYKLEFDYLHIRGINDQNPCKEGLAFYDGAGNQLLTFYSRNTTMKVYKGTDTATSYANVDVTKTTKDGIDTASAKPIWLHVTLFNDADGLSLQLTKLNDGTAIAIDGSTTPFTLTNQAVKLEKMMLVTGRYSGRTQYTGLDDFKCYYPVAGQTFTWTGAAADNAWATPGNWSVGGTPQTEFFPGKDDAAIIADSGLSITTPVGTVVSNLNLAAGSALVFDVSALSKNAPQDLIEVAENTGTALSADNVRVSGTPSGCSPVFDFSVNPVTVTLWNQYVWTGNGSNTRFSTPANWACGASDGPAATVCPGAGGSVTFPASFTEGVTVTFSDNTGSGIAFTLDCDVTFSCRGMTRRHFDPSSISGSGKILLDCVKMQTVAGKTLEINNPIEVIGDSELYSYAKDSHLKVYGAVTGDATLTFNDNSQARNYGELDGDTSGFTGTIAVGRYLVIRNNAALDLSGATLDVADQTLELPADGCTATTLKAGALAGTGTIKNATGNAMTLEVGALNSPSSSSATLEGAWSLKKVGTGTMTWSGSNASNVTVTAGMLALPKGTSFAGALSVTGGKVGFTADPSGATETLLTWLTEGSSVTLADFDLSVELPLKLKLVSDADAGTTSLVVERLPYVWNGTTDNRWANAANWLLDGETASTYPTTASDTVNFDGQTVTVAIEPNMTTFGTLTGTNNTTFAILFTAASKSYSIPEGMTTNQFVAAAPFASTWTETACVSGARAAATYSWVGGNGAWSDAANWQTDGKATGVYPNGSDAASFDSAATVTLTEEAQINTLTIAENVRAQFGSDDYKVLWIKEVAGDATSTFALSNVIVIANVDNAPIGGRIELVAGTSNGLYAASSKGLKVNGNLIGSGAVYFKNNSGSRAGVYLYGDNSQYSGDAHILMGNGKDMKGNTGGATYFKWQTLASGSANARWFVEGFDSGKGAMMADATLTSEENPFKMTPEGSYDFTGGANGLFYIECGHSYDTEYSGTIHRGSSSNAIRLTKVGSGTFLFSGTLENRENYVSTITVEEGALKVGSSNPMTGAGIIMAGGVLKTAKVDDVKIDPSAKLSTSSTATIIYDDEGDDSVWETALDKASTHGLTKRGAGTLTIKSVELKGALQVLGGKIAISDAVTGAGQELLSWDVVDGAKEVTLSDFALAEAPALGYAIVTNEARVALVTQRVPADYGYAGATDGLWTDAANWTVSESSTPFYPESGDTATIGADVTVTTAVGQVVKKLTIDATSKLAFDLSDVTTYNEPVTLFTVSDGASPLTAANITLTGYSSDAYKAVVSVGATAVTVTLYDKTKFVWTGTAGDRLFDTAGNWVWGAAGGPVAESAPTATSTLTIGADQTVIVKQNQGFATVTADATTTFAVLFTANNQVFAPPEGYSGKVSALGPFTVTATAPYTATRVASANFTWVGPSGDWAEVSNWAVGGNPTGVGPGETDNAIFDDDADGKTIQFNADAKIATNFFGNARVRFSNDFEFRVDISTNLPGKTGTMVLADAIHLRSGSAAGTGCYSVDIEVPADEAAYIELTDKNIKPKVYGAIRGSGLLYLKNNTSDNYVGPHVYGDMSAFEGTVEVVQKNAGKNVRNNTKLHDGDGDGLFSASNAVWNVYNTQVDAILDAGVNYSFGALNGAMYQGNYKDGEGKDYVKAGLIEVGALNTDCELNGGLAETPIRKIGSAIFACGAKHIGNVEIVDGTYKLLNNTQKGTVTFSGGTFEIDTDISATIDYAAKFVNSTAAMTVDIGTSDRIWATAIPASNVGGFTKKGTATLTLEKSPLYSGKTTVDAGTLVLPKGTELNGTLSVTGGKIGLDGDYSGFAETLLTWTRDAELAEVTTNDFAIESPVAPLSLAIVTNEIKVSLVVVRSAQTYTYVGADFGEWNAVSNWKVGEDAATVVPNAADDVIIGEGKRVIVATDRTAFGGVTLNGGAKLAIAFTEDCVYSPTTTLGENDFIVIGPFAATYSEGTFTATRVASTFTWAGADGDWSDLANWRVSELPTAVLPGQNDSIVFPAVLNAVAVTIDADSYASNVWTDAQLTLSGDSSCKLYGNFYRGPGKIVMNGVQLGAQLSEDMIISNDLEVVENTTNTIWLASKQNCETCGNITGSGLFRWDCGTQNAAQWNGIYFRGTNTAFAGTFQQLRGFGGRSGMGADYCTATSSNAVWLANAQAKDNTTRPFFLKSALGTYCFGAIQGAIQGGGYAPTFEIGNRDDYDSEFLFLSRTSQGGSTPACTITKVGASKLSVRCAGVSGNGTPSQMLGTLALKGGTTWAQYVPTTTLTFAGAGATLQMNTNGTDVADALLLDPSAKIKDSTSAICFDDQGTNATWETALADTNVGGFTKKGAGTLTLSAAPAYAGVTRVDAGTLVMPDETKVAWDAASAGTLSGGTITNVAFVAGEISTTVVTEATTVREYECAVDCTQLAIDLTAKTDWTKDATYYVVTPAGIVAGTSIVIDTSVTFLLPTAQQGKWKLDVVTLPSGKKALAVVRSPIRSRRGVLMTYH